jgi:uncharacterized protein (TIGR02145 family)
LLTDLFLVKFTQNGNRIWGTYYGGECIDDPGIFSNCAVDGNSHVYICGSTCSLTNISTAGSFQPGTNGGDDGFLVQLDTSGVRQWGTYYGGALDDQINYIKVAPNGRIILAGETQSVTGIASPGAFQTAFGGGNEDAFLGRFYPDGQRHWVTYYGGVEIDAAHAGDIDANGNLYFCGFTKSLTAIATPGVFQPAYGGGAWDAMMMKFDSSGNRLWGSYYGGEGNDWAYDFNYLGMNSLYLAGGTSSLTNVATTGSQQPVYGGGIWDGFLAKFIECLLPDTVSGISGPDTVCAGSAGVEYSIPSMPYASGYFWEVPVGSMITSGQNTQQITVTFGGTTLSGYLSVRGTNNCGMGEPNRLYITVYPSPIPTLTGDDSVCSGQQSTYLTDSGQSQYQWAVSPGGMVINGGTLSDTTITILWLNTGSNWVRINYLDSNGCFALIPSQQNVLVYEANTANISISTLNSEVCSGTFVTFVASSDNGGSNPNFQWIVNNINTGSNDSSFSYYPSDDDTVRCILTSSIQNCISNNPATSNPIVMTVDSLLPVSITVTPSQNPVCGNIPVTLTATPTNGGSSPIYQWQVNGINAGTNSPIFTYIPMTNDQITCILTASELCTSGNPATSNSIIMTVAEAPVVSFTPCFDTITTINAKPIRLKGGIPLGGTYSGSGVSSESGGSGVLYYFNPAIAGTGNHLITYSYTNSALCTDARYVIIDTRSAAPFSCGNDLLDIRDSSVYPTVQIGIQCWMAANLNYGTEIPYTTPQRDNCIPEKYCNTMLPVPCALSSALYQWDEVMTYTDSEEAQGLCPPGWHIPSEADWQELFAVYQGNAFAGKPLLYSGYSGFNAQLTGIAAFNLSWHFDGFATIWWSSTSHGPWKAWTHGMNEYNYSVSYYPSYRANGFSIRCLLD